MKNFKLKKWLGLLLFSFIFVIFFVAFFSLTHAYAQNTGANQPPAFLNVTASVEPLYKTLKDTGSGYGKIVSDVASSLLNVVNGFVIVVLIVVAFAQILRLNINTYGVKKILPTLVMAVVGANFAFLFCRIMIDFANVVMAGIVQNGGGISLTSSFSDPVWAKPASFAPLYGSDSAGGNVFWFFIMQLVAIAMGVLITILAFLFYIRQYVIYFIVALSPAAFMMTVLPQTKGLFNQWWGNFSKWTFMPVVSVFWLWLGSRWLTVLMNNTTGAANSIFTIVFAGACFYFAITTPFKMGGAIMNQWSKLGKNAWNKTAGKAGSYGIGQVKKGAGWVAGGGIQSMMAYRNQMAAKKLGADADKYRRKADRWTMFNPKARLEAYKARRQTIADNYASAPKKTDYYSKKLGAAGAVKAGMEGNIEDYRGATPARLGVDLASKLDGIKNSKGKGEEIYKFFKKQANDPSNLTDAKALGFVDKTGKLDVEGYAKHRMADYLRTTNPAVIAQNFAGAGLSDFQLGDLKALATAFMQKMGSARKAEAFEAAYGYAPNRFDRRTGSPMPSSAVGEITGIIGGEVSQQVIRAAAHGVGGFDQVAAQAGLDLGQLTPEAVSSVKKSFEEIRGTRDKMVQDAVSEGNKLLEEKLLGAKEVINAGYVHGIPPTRIQGGLNEAKQLMTDNKIQEAAAALQKSTGVTISAIPINQNISAEQLKTLQGDVEKRIGHLELGLEHFSEQKQRFASIENPSDRLAAISNANRLVQTNPDAYIDQTRKALKQEVSADARAQVASQMAAGNLASNPATANLSVGQMASNEHVLEEMAHAMDGMQKSMSANTGGSGLNQVTKIDPISMGAKQMLADSLNTTIRQGIVDASTKMTEAFQSKGFINSIAEGIKRGNREAPQKVVVKKQE